MVSPARYPHLQGSVYATATAISNAHTAQPIPSAEMNARCRVKRPARPTTNSGIENGAMMYPMDIIVASEAIQIKDARAKLASTSFARCVSVSLIRHPFSARCYGDGKSPQHEHSL